jgi:hypothetical protein
VGAGCGFLVEDGDERPMTAGDLHGLEQPNAAAFINDGFDGLNHNSQHSCCGKQAQSPNDRPEAQAGVSFLLPVHPRTKSDIENQKS